MARRRDYLYQVTRIMPDGAEEPMPLEQVAERGLYFYGLRGHDDWESAERFLVDQYHDGVWNPGRYKVEVTLRTETGDHPVTTVERLLPLHPDYAKLPHSPFPGDKRPARAYLHTLLSRYPNTSLELVAQHLDDFDAHYRAQLSTPELTARTGYKPPSDWVRPLSPYADDLTEDTQ